MITWNELAVIPQFTDFVQWAVANHGPLPDGEIQQQDYDRLLNLYYARPENQEPQGRPDGS